MEDTTKKEMQEAAFLADWYACPVFYIDMLYPTIVHAYEAQKIEIRKQGQERRVIGDLPTARLAREAGQAIHMSLEHVQWFEANSQMIKSDLLVAKFGQKEMREKLAAISEEQITSYLGFNYESLTIINIKKAQEGVRKDEVHTDWG